MADECQRCESPRLLSFSGNTSDRFYAAFNNREYNGYVIHDAGIGGGDYLGAEVCLECGQLQGEWPKSDPEFAEDKLCPECVGVIMEDRGNYCICPNCNEVSYL